MKRTVILFVLAMLLIHFCPAYAQLANKRVLIFSKTSGFRHSSIEHGTAVLKKMFEAQGVLIQHSEDAALFSDAGLSELDAIIFLSTTGDIFNESQKAAFEKFIRSGKGFVGIHAASDTEYNWPWYGQMVGGYFASHPAVQEATIHVVNRKHLSTKHLESDWKHRDEWYDFKNVQPDNKVLMKLDEKSYKGGKMGDNHPIAWYKEFDGGRIFYTGLGHTEEAYDDIDFQKHVLGGLKYVLGGK